MNSNVRSRRNCLVILVMLVWLNTPVSPLDAQAPEKDAGDPPSPVSLALSTMFSPLEAPDRKTMGLLQRNFLDMAGGSETELEVALVIDGTDSMSAELGGVRQSVDRMLQDLRRFRSKEIRVAVVVYRDHGAVSGEFSIPLRNFTSDAETIDQAIGTLQPESGAPFFQELPDVGLHVALTQLPWTDDPSVTKWILLFGDAPPYDVAQKYPDYPTARRRYTDALLGSLARNRNIRINCVLCTSSEENSQSYEQVIDQTRGFMSQLASDTDGVMLDLSYPAIQKALVQAAKTPDVNYQQIASITEADLAAVRQVDAARAPAEIVIAVVPHEPLDSVRFDPQLDSVQVATAIRYQFAQLPGVRTVSPVDVQRQLRRLRAEGLSDNQTVRGLAGRLGVDYVLWGQVSAGDATVQTAAYRRRDGQAVVRVSFDGDRGRLTDVILTAAAKEGQPDEAITRLARAVQKNASEARLLGPIAESGATTAELLSAIESLGQALAYPAGSEESVQRLGQARRSSQAAAAAEPRNPIAQWLSANALFNLAAHQFRAGDDDAARALMSESKSALRRAARSVDRVASEALALEIRADEALLIRGDAEQAVATYQTLTETQMPRASQLRGHWMLAGIYAGDWGVSRSVVDRQKSRQHVIQILANWPDSPEASQLKHWLMWDDAAGETRHNYLPLINAEMSEVDGV
ncbi:VWA domain-containing protein [Roseiconus nitratireducens]|uniref:VWA domain-containing protein n=1 Tax=Roseiconus nitratireducens TaxID=2605748 RepID=A0A5M6DBM5_9BACT|nr:vWA domain-containing protein [Roseiconus nitratireducens]KAA5543722.1 VWA domain-containing protein [Roseiconus nitratireducens]